MSKIFEFLYSRQLRKEEQVEAYHAASAIGHTKLVNFEIYGPSALRKDFRINTTDAMEFGSIVDTLLTRSSDFTNIYYIPSSKIKLTPSQSTFVDYIVEHKYNPYSFTDEELLAVLDHCKTYTTMTKNIAARIEKARVLFPLITERLQNADKKIITAEQFNTAMNCIEAIKTSDITKDLFVDEDKLLFQVELYLRELDVHCLFDMIYMDFKNKIIHPIDLKCTSYPERDFLSNSFYKFKYYRQAELYIYILKQFLDFYDSEEWKIAPFKFLVVCKDTLSPMLYEFPVKYNGEKLVISETREVDSMFKLLEDIRWHMYNQQYMYDKETYIQLFKQKKSKDKQFVVKPIITVPENERNIVLHTATNKHNIIYNTDFFNELRQEAQNLIRNSNSVTEQRPRRTRNTTTSEQTSLNQQLTIERPIPIITNDVAWTVHPAEMFTVSDALDGVEDLTITTGDNTNDLDSSVPF